MIKFDENEVLANFAKIYQKRQQIEAIADRIASKNKVMFVSSGGSMSLLDPFANIVKKYSRIPCERMLAAELVVCDSTILDNDTIVFMTSKSGDTADTVAAARLIREKGSEIISVIGKADSELETLSHECVVYQDGRPQELIFLLLILRFLHQKQCFSDYVEFADQLSNLGNVLVQVRKDFDDDARRYAEKNANEPYNIFVASGLLWPTAYSYSMCVLEESLWLPTKSVSSSEFFHGTLELIEDGSCVTILLSSGPTRLLDQRVADFCRQRTTNTNVFDARIADLSGFSEAYRELLDPMILAAMLQRVSRNLEDIKKHPLETRRYYRTVNY